MIDLNKNIEPLDLSYLREMSGNSVEFIIEMLDLFKVQTPIHIADLELALDGKDWAKVADLVHKIKPTFIYVGRADARDYMQLIERNAREQRDLETIPQACNEIFAFMTVLYQQLDEARMVLEKQL